MNELFMPLPPPEPPETCDHCGSNIIRDPRCLGAWGHNNTRYLYQTIHAPLRGPAVLATPRVKR